MVIYQKYSIIHDSRSSRLKTMELSIQTITLPPTK